MRRLALLALALCACKPAAPPAAPTDAGALDVTNSKALLAEVDRLKDQLKDKPKTFEVLGALGSLYYDNGRYLEAVDALRQAEELSAPAEAESEALRKQGVKPAGDLPNLCRRSGADYGLAQIAEAARKLDAPHQLRCLEAVLQLALDVHARRGNSFYLIGNADAALALHRKVLERAPDYAESLFFVGAILLEQSQGDKGKLAEGKKYWARLLQVAPDSPRSPLVRDALPKAEEIFKPRPESALPAGHPDLAQQDPGLPAGHAGLSGGQPGAPMNHSGSPAEPTPDQLQNLQEAVQNTARTPELEKGLDDLLAEGEKALDEGKFQEARDAVVRVMPMRPSDARTAADLGGAMRGLGRTEMAQRTLGRALQLDPRQPRALYEMGKLQAQQGDKQGARQSFTALQAADAKFAQAHKVDEELGKLQ